MSLADDYIGLAAERRIPRSAASQLADSGALDRTWPTTPEEATALQQEEAAQRAAGYAQRDRDLADRAVPFGAGPVVRPLVNMASDPDRRRRLGDAAQTPQARLGAALVLTPGLAPGALAMGARQAPAAARRLGHGAVSAAREAPSALARGFDWFANDPAPREFVAGLPRSLTYGPWENERLAQHELDVSRARRDESGVNDAADAANLETLFAALNAPLPGLGAADDAARALRRQRSARRLGSTADTASGAERVYRPAPQTEIVVAPDGRISALYQGAFEASAGSADEVASALREGSGQEALGFWRSVESALNEDIAATQRPEYYWAPGATGEPNERLARFYRRALQTRAPEGYAFSETPDGVMRLVRETPRRLGVSRVEGDAARSEAPFAAFMQRQRQGAASVADAAPWRDTLVGDEAPRRLATENRPSNRMSVDEGILANAGGASRRVTQRMQAAVRDPQTGQTYTGANHADAIENAPPAAAERLWAAYEADQNFSGAGFLRDGEFLTRDEALAALGDSAFGRAHAPRNANPSVNAGPEQPPIEAGTSADFVESLPTQRERLSAAQYQEIAQMHPWFRNARNGAPSPGRIDLIRLSAARDESGRFLYSEDAIANATGLTRDSVRMTRTGARKAGIPVPERPQGQGGATRILGGPETNRILEAGERFTRNGEAPTMAQIAEIVGKPPKLVYHILYNTANLRNVADSAVRDRARALLRANERAWRRLRDGNAGAIALGAGAATMADDAEAGQAGALDAGEIEDDWIGPLAIGGITALAMRGRGGGRRLGRSADTHGLDALRRRIAEADALPNKAQRTAALRALFADLGQPMSVRQLADMRTNVDVGRAWDAPIPRDVSESALGRVGAPPGRPFVDEPATAVGEDGLTAPYMRPRRRLGAQGLAEGAQYERTQLLPQVPDADIASFASDPAWGATAAERRSRMAAFANEIGAEIATRTNGDIDARATMRNILDAATDHESFRPRRLGGETHRRLTPKARAIMARLREAGLLSVGGALAVGVGDSPLVAAR